MKKNRKNPPKRHNEVTEVKCIGLTNEGKGRVKVKNKVYEVANLLHGEEATVNVNKHYKGVHLELAGITKASSDRVKPPCPYYFKCGGCHLQHMQEQAQQRFKEHVVIDLMKSYAKVQPIIAMDDPFAYRNKSHITFGLDRKGKTISGIYAEKSHRIIPMERCLIHHEQADAIAGTVKKLMKSFKMYPYDEDSQRGLLRHVLIRRGHVSKEVMVVLVVGSPIFPSKKNFVKALRKEHPEITTILLSINQKRTSLVLGDREIVLYGRGVIKDTLCGLDFEISAKSFYQINSVQTEKLYNIAMEMADLKGTETVIDAYCGIGTIGLIASQKAAHVIGVELNKGAVKDAIRNAKRNGITNARFYQGDAGEFMVGMAEEGEKADVVIMDPPRSGSDEKFLSSVVKLAPKRIVYVSCNPETQARDLKYLVKKGYKVEGIQPVDMFPQTYHVENVVAMSKR